MKSMLKRLRALLLASMILVPALLFAQTGFDDDVEDNAVPFDGGVSLLVAAGIGYGIKKVRDSRKANKQED